MVNTAPLTRLLKSFHKSRPRPGHFHGSSKSFFTRGFFKKKCSLLLIIYEQGWSQTKQHCAESADFGIFIIQHTLYFIVALSVIVHLSKTPKTIQAHGNKEKTESRFKTKLISSLNCPQQEAQSLKTYSNNVGRSALKEPASGWLRQ